ncbi:MAG: hypothetical protein ACOCYO_04180 [Bacteroidota bacterium]
MRLSGKEKNQKHKTEFQRGQRSLVKSATSYLSPICHPGDEEDFPFFYHFAGQEFFVFSDGSRNSPDLEMITGRYSDGGVK